jgi:UDP-2,3-diacylglucosamine pyrophosphatase LpxH
MDKKIKPYPMASLDNIIPLIIDDRIGIVSDVHYGSKSCKKEHFNEMYDTFASRGVKQVFNAGDLTDGTSVYRGQLYNLSKIGYEEQAQEVIKEHPKKRGIKSYLIMGNHDADYMKHQGADIIKYITACRSDLENCGIYYARFKDVNDGIKLDMFHPDGGSQYALSYGTQKYLRDSPPSHHPNILIAGHRHQHFYGNIQEVDAIEAGTFQGPNDFSIRRNQAGGVGGWIIDMERKDGKIKRFKPEWIGFNGRAL